MLKSLEEYAKERACDDQQQRPQRVDDGTMRLHRALGEEQDAIDRAEYIAKEYDNSRRLAAQNATKILTGIRAGENVYRLFVYALETIGAMTGEQQIYQDAIKNLFAIYGCGLNDPAPIEAEIEQTLSRVSTLSEALQKTESEDQRRRIQNAIRRNENAAKKLREKGAKTGQNKTLTISGV